MKQGGIPMSGLVRSTRHLLRLALVPMVLIATSSVASAQTASPNLGVQLARAAHDVSAAYLRRGAVFAADSYDQLPAVARKADLYPAYLFAPSSRVSWSVVALDADRSQACFQITANSANEWNSAVKAFTTGGLTPQTPNCAAQTNLSPPRAYPSTVYTSVVLDRRSVALPTEATAGLQMSISSGGTTTAVSTGQTSVAAILQAYSGQVSASMTFQVTNQTTYGPLQLTGISSTPGFELGTNNCDGLDIGQTCAVTVDFNPQQVSGSTAGRLRMSFSHKLADGTVDATPELTATLFGQLLQ